MYLEYGIGTHGELVYIDQVKRGKTDLKCPYCGVLLLARKGEKVVHHFAHTGETCRQVERNPDDISLPAYEKFNLYVPGKVVELLKDIGSRIDTYNYGMTHDGEELESYDLVKFNEFKGRRGGYELTKKGKLILGQLSLLLFNEFQEPLIVERHQHLDSVVRKAHERILLRAELNDLEDKYREFKGIEEQLRAELGAFNYMRDPRYRTAGEVWQPYNDRYWRLKAEFSNRRHMDYETAAIDLRLYRAQWQRILKTTLYFLAVKHDNGTFYKIGVTTREITERVAEVQQELIPYLGNTKIQVLGTWAHRGNVELYFKYRYKDHCTPIGSLSEYYTFEDIKPVLRDLRRMKVKELTDLERSVLVGDLPPFENELRLAAIEKRRVEQVKIGMERARHRGKHVGRPPGVTKETPEEFLAKPKTIEIRHWLEQGMGLRETARLTHVAVNTVVKVKRIIEALQAASSQA